MKNPQSNLPPGFRFHPTDEELILHYLRNKVTSMPLPVSIIAEVDIYKLDPWDLPAKATFGEKEWYFFSPRDRKYPNGARPNRSAASGYWKATGTDKTIITPSAAAIGSGGRHNIGVKKALVFYKGRPPKGIKTNWIMHEYRLADTNKPTVLKDSSMRLDNWVLCRIYKKTNIASPTVRILSDQDQEEQFIQETFLPSLRSLPDGLDDKYLQPQKSSSFSNLFDAMDYSLLSSFLSDNPMGFETTPTFSTSVHALSQPFYADNCNNNNNNNDGNLFQRLPQLSSSAPSTENRLKRHFMNVDDEHDTINSSKKYISSCCFLNSNIQPDVHQNPMNLPYLNQQFLLSPDLQFQG